MKNMNKVERKRLVKMLMLKRKKMKMKIKVSLKLKVKKKIGDGRRTRRVRKVVKKEVLLEAMRN